MPPSRDAHLYSRGVCGVFPITVTMFQQQKHITVVSSVSKLYTNYCILLPFWQTVHYDISYIADTGDGNEVSEVCLPVFPWLCVNGSV